MNKQLKFQSKIICKNGNIEQTFVSNPLYIAYREESTMKNVYTWEKYMEIINKCNDNCKGQMSVFEYLAMCLKSIFC